MCKQYTQSIVKKLSFDDDIGDPDFEQSDDEWGSSSDSDGDDAGLDLSKLDDNIPVDQSLKEILGNRITGMESEFDDDSILKAVENNEINEDDIIENQEEAGSSKIEEEAWRKIADAFNSCNPMRSIAQMKRKSKYDNLKTAARRFSGNANRNLYGTGGRPPVVVNPNPVYDEVLSIKNCVGADLENEVGIENERTEIYQDQIIVDENKIHETEEAQNNT
ncbi:unnamed protein product [Psylliodes chrysocephalus]|uniref:Regulatory protein zeste n=1 Tax=Psylliodes chrysocephalus TaxID=3402493 RepID=A0A9P0GA41_9CUCU|nr:unnamed protein product [Psylliodes chrysocephala]